MSESDELAADILAAVEQSKATETGSLSKGTSSQPKSAPVSNVPSMGDSPSDRPGEGIDMSELTELIEAVHGLNATLNGNFAVKLAEEIQKSLAPQFAALEQKIAAAASASPSPAGSTLVKPSFPAAVLTSVGQLKVVEINKSEGDCKTQLEQIVNSLKGSYPQVKRNELDEQIMEATEDHGLLVKQYFVRVLNTVLDESYGSADQPAPAVSRIRMPKFSAGRTGAPTNPPSGGSNRPNWGRGAK